MEKARQGDGMYVRADFLQKRTHRALPHAPQGNVIAGAPRPAPRHWKKGICEAPPRAPLRVLFWEKEP